MLRNSLKIALRHLWRNRFYTALHILGLSISLSAAWIIFRVVSYEFSFDQQQPDKERIFRIVSHSKTEGQDNANSMPVVGLSGCRSQKKSGICQTQNKPKLPEQQALLTSRFFCT